MLRPTVESWIKVTPVIAFLAAASTWLDIPLQQTIVNAQSSYDSGKRTYQVACSPCHGRNGDANTPFAKALDPTPRDFTKGVYKFRSTFPGALPTDDDLKRTIQRGIPGTSMPAWKGILSPSEIEGVIRYIKDFSPYFTQWTDFDTLVHSPPPALSQQGISRGKEIYKIMGCWNCHGRQGRGDGPSARGLLDEDKNPIPAYDFTGGNFKGGSGMSDIYRTLMTGLRGAPMPSFYWAFGFAREDLQELFTKEVYQQYFSSSELDHLKKFIETVPTKLELRAMDSTQLNQVTEQSRWELVQYINSLKRNPSPLSELFLRDHELTR